VQLVALQENSLPLVATALTLTLQVPTEEAVPSPAEAEGLGVVATVGGAGITVGQGPIATTRGGGSTAGQPDESGEASASEGAAPSALAPWERFVLGLDKALEEVDREGAGGAPGPSEPADRPAPPPGPGVPAQGRESGVRSVPERPAGAKPEDLDAFLLPGRAGTIDAAIARLETDRAASGPGEMGRSATGTGREEPGLAAACFVVSVLGSRFGSSDFTQRRKDPQRRREVRPIPRPIGRERLGIACSDSWSSLRLSGSLRLCVKLSL
jgi:hypothetical protein